MHVLVIDGIAVEIPGPVVQGLLPDTAGNPVVDGEHVFPGLLPTREVVAVPAIPVVNMEGIPEVVHGRIIAWSAVQQVQHEDFVEKGRVPHFP